MATKPSIFVDYAKNANYSIGPQAGQPTKVAIDAQDIDEGNIKGPVFFPDAQKFNYVQNAYGLWIRWIDEEVFSTEDDEFQSRLADKASPTNVDLLILESQVDGFAKRKVTVANLLGSLSWKDVLDADPVSGANTPIISQGQKIRGTTAASGGALPVIGGDGTTGPGGPGQIGGGDTATGSAAGDGVVSGGDATAGTGAGGDAISRPGTSFGGVAGKVLWELPNGDVIAMPSAKALVAGQVLTDAAADGNLSWAAGGNQDLASVLGEGTSTGANDIIVESGQKISGVSGTTGTEMNLRGGDGTTGPGGIAFIAGGLTSAGSADAGGVTLAPGTSNGGNDGQLIFQMPVGTDFIWPPIVGSSGSVLTDAAGDGVLSWAAGGGGGGLTMIAQISISFTATIGQRQLFDPSPGGRTVTVPGSPALGDEFAVTNNSGSLVTYTIDGDGVLVQNPETGLMLASYVISRIGDMKFANDGTDWILL